jgi:hypothetical protein
LPAGEVGWRKFHKRDFSALETVGCDGHHIITDPTDNRVALRVAGGAMKAPPDDLHAISFTESETVDCDGQHNRALAQGPTSNVCPVW